MTEHLQALAPDQARAARDFFLPAIESSHRINRMLIQAVPADKLSFQPDPASLPLSEILVSLVATEHYFLTSICDGRVPNEPAMPTEKTIDALLAWDEAHFPNDLQRLAALDAESLLQPVDFFGASSPAIELLHVYMGNMSQHRGQLAIYLQLCGTPQQHAGSAADGELAEADLAGVAGGNTTNYGVQVTFVQSNQTAQQLGWLPAPQTQATLGQLFSSTPSQAGFAGLPAGLLAAISIPMYISTFFML